MNIRLNAIVYFFVSIVIFLATFAIILFDIIKPIQYESDQKMVESIQKLKTLDANWSLSALELYNNPQFSFDFDQTANYLPRFRELRDELKIFSQKRKENIQVIPQKLKNKFNEFIALAEAKEISVETFKSDFAVIRNSTKYLPIAAKELTSLRKKKSKNEIIFKKFNELYVRVEDFLKFPDEIKKAILLKRIKETEQGLVDYPSSISNIIDNFISHSRVLINRTIGFNETLNNLTDNRITAVGNDLIILYKNHIKEINNKANTIKKNRKVISYSLLTLSLLLSIFSILLLWKKELILNQLLSKHDSNNELASGTSAAKNMEKMAEELTHKIETPVYYLNSNIKILNGYINDLQSLAEDFDTLNNALSKPEDKSAISSIVKKLSSTVQEINGIPTLHGAAEISEGMTKEIEHINKIVSGLKDLTHKDQSIKDWFKIENCINNSLKVTQGKIPENIQIIKKIDTVPNIYGSPRQINQVITNLIHNSSQALSETKREKSIIQIQVTQKKSYASINITDNGIGVDNNIKDRIFDPFFTTKKVSESTGLGLAIVNKIITNHNGKIFVKSKYKKGTSITFTLPIDKSKGNDEKIA